MASFYNVPGKGLSDVTTTLLTSSSDSTIILSILCANTTVSASDVTISQLDAADAVDATIANTITIPVDSSLEILGNKLILPSGKKLQFSTSTSGSIDVSISYVEV